MKEFHCGSLVPGCDWHTPAEEEAEVIRRAAEHMRETHGFSRFAPSSSVARSSEKPEAIHSLSSLFSAAPSFGPGSNPRAARSPPFNGNAGFSHFSAKRMSRE